MSKIALGGGCHWCTEAIFQSLKGVLNVEQGFVASEAPDSSFSEAVIVHFNPEEIPLKVLIEIHLHTHQSASNHSMRKKYRSAVYVFSDVQQVEVTQLIARFQNDFGLNLITQVLFFSEFKESLETFQNYYQKNPKKPFCKTYINPKLQLLLKQFSTYADIGKLKSLQDDDVL